MSTDEDGDKLKLFWDLFFKAETGTYEKSTWLDLFLAEFLIRLNEGGDPKELIKFCPISGVVTLVGCELLCGIHRVTSAINAHYTLPVPCLENPCTSLEDAPPEKPQEEEKADPAPGTGLFSRANAQSSTEILRNYLLSGVAWRCLILLKALGVEGLSCCRQLSSVLIWVCGELGAGAAGGAGGAGGARNPHVPVSRAHDQIYQLLENRIWSKQKLGSSQPKLSSSATKESASGRGRRVSQARGADVVDGPARRGASPDPSSDSGSDADLQLLNRSLTMKLGPPDRDFDYFTSPARDPPPAPSPSLYGDPFHSPRKTKPKAVDYMTDRHKDIINSQISLYEFTILVAALLQELCRADSSLAGAEGSQISVQCINYSLRNLCSLQFGAVHKYDAKEVSRIKVALTELLIVSLDKVLVRSDLCSKLITNGILPMILRILEDVICKSNSKYHKTDEKQQNGDAEPMDDDESENQLKFVFGISYSIVAFFYCLLLQCRSVEQLRQFTEQFRLYGECLKGALLQQVVALLARLPGAAAAAAPPLIKKLVEALGKLICEMKRVRGEVLHSAACARARHKACRARVAAGLHHHHDVLGEAGAPPVRPAGCCCVALLYGTLLALAGDEAVAGSAALRRKLLRVLLASGACCCVSAGHLMESMVRLMLTHGGAAPLALQVLERTVYGELGASVLRARARDQLPCAVCQPCDERRADFGKTKFYTYGAGAVERKSLWSFLVHYNSLLQLDNPGGVLAAALAHLLRATPRCRREVQHDLLFSVLYPSFIVAKHRYLIRAEESAYFLTVSCLDIFASLLNTVSFAEQFIQKGGLSYVLELVALPEFSKQCCSILEIAIIVEIFKMMKDNATEMSYYRDINSLVSVQMLLKSLDDATDKCYKIYKIKLPSDKFEELTDVSKELEAFGTEIERRDSAVLATRKASTAVAIKTSFAYSENETEDGVEDYIEVLRSVCTFWRCAAGLCLCAPLLRRRLAGGGALRDSYALLRLLLHALHDAGEHETRQLVKIIEALLTVQFALSEETSGRSKALSCSVVGGWRGGGAGRRALCEALLRVAAAAPSARLAMPPRDPPKLPPLACVPGSESSLERWSSDESIAPPYASDHSEPARPDAGYEADVEIGKFDQPTTHKVLKPSNNTTCSGHVIGLEPEPAEADVQCPEYARSGALAHPELCLIVVDMLTELIHKVMSGDSSCLTLAKACCARLSQSLARAPPPKTPLRLLKALLSGAGADLLSTSDPKLEELQRSVLELIEVVAASGIEPSELALYLKLLQRGAAPLGALLATLQRLAAAAAPHTPPCLLAFPSPPTDEYQPPPAPEPGQSNSQSHQAETFARHLFDQHTKAGIKSSWSSAAARCGIEGAGWGPWLQGFAAVAWLQAASPAPTTTHADTSEDSEAPPTPAPRRPAQPADLAHLFSIGHDSLMFEVWMDPTTGILTFRLSRPEASSYKVLSETSVEAIPLQQWCCLGLNVKELVHKRKIHIQVTVFVNGCEIETVSLPLQGILVRKIMPTMVLIGQYGGGAPWYLSDVSVYRAPCLCRGGALRRAALGPLAPTSLDAPVEKQFPNYALVTTPELLDRNVDWDQVFDMTPSKAKELEDNILLTFSASSPATMNLYHQTVALPTVFAGRVGSTASLLASSAAGIAVSSGPSSSIPEALNVTWTGAPLPSQHRGVPPAVYMLGGVDVLLFMFARVVELDSTDEEQATALSILLQLCLVDQQLYCSLYCDEKLAMLNTVLASNRCKFTHHMLKSFLDAACNVPILTISGSRIVVRSRTDVCVREPCAIILCVRAAKDMDQEEYRWEEDGRLARGSLWALLLSCVCALLDEGAPHRQHNRARLERAELMRHLLLACKERFLNSGLGPLDRECSAALLRALRHLPSSPPQPPHLALLTDVLLLLHQASDTFVTHSRANFYFLLTSETQDTSENTFLNFMSRRKSSRRGKRKSGSTSNTSRTRSTNSSINSEDILLNENNVNVLREMAQNREAHDNESIKEDQISVDSTKQLKGFINLQIKERRKHNISSTSVSENSDVTPEDCMGAVAGATSQEADGVTSQGPEGVTSHGPESVTSQQPEGVTSPADGSTTADLMTSQAVDGALSDYVVIDVDDVTHTTVEMYTSGIFEQRRVRAGAEGGWAVCEGILNLLHDAITVMPESDLNVAAAGPLKPERLVVLGHHRNGGVRAALVRVLGALQRRAPRRPPPLLNVHLADQIALYPGTWDLATACAGLLTKCDVPLEDQLDDDIWLDLGEEAACSAAPLLAVLPRCLDDVPLAHNITLLIRRLIDKVSLKALSEVAVVEVVVRSITAVGSMPDQDFEGRELLLEDLYELLNKIALKALATQHNMQIVTEIHHMLTYIEASACSPDPEDPEVETPSSQQAGQWAAARAAQCRLCVAQITYLDNELSASGSARQTNYFTSVLSSAVSLATDGVPRTELQARRRAAVTKAVSLLVSRPTHLDLTSAERALFELTFNMLLTAISESVSARGKWWGGGSGAAEWTPDLHDLCFWAFGGAKATRPLEPYVLRTLYQANEQTQLVATPTDPAAQRKLAVYLLRVLQRIHLSNSALPASLLPLAITDWARGWALATQAALPDRLLADVVREEAVRLSRADRQRWTKAARPNRDSVAKVVFRHEALATKTTESAMLITRSVVDEQNAERKAFMEHLRRAQARTVAAAEAWQRLLADYTHELALWHDPASYPRSWALDSTEGAGRVRVRLRRAHCALPPRFLQPDMRHKADTLRQWAPLQRVVGAMRALQRGLVARLQLHETVTLMARVRYVRASRDQPGELLLSDRSIHFVPEDSEDELEVDEEGPKKREKYISDAPEQLSWTLEQVRGVATRRWCLREVAVEIFLYTGHAHLIAFDDPADRAAFLRALPRSEPDNLQESMNLWRQGLITNWEYLMRLNGLAGRSYNDLMQYPIFPFVIADYTSRILDLNDPKSFRDFSKPMAVQNKKREQHYINTYNDLSVARREGCSSALSRRPHHYASLYSNSGAVLHYLVRVPPFTELFLNYQDNNFDMPDRTFHSLQTTWRLITQDSPTDVKELIPELFFLPELFKNTEGLNLGVRQCGAAVDDVELPPWAAGDPRLFTLIHRQALESPIVTEQLPHWIDLVFGYKQTGQAAIDAINVFPACTYYGFDPSVLEDSLERTAAEAMVRTYGQAPRQLLRAPHARPQPDLHPAPPAEEVWSGVSGARWGAYVGAPPSPPPRATRRSLPDARSLQPLPAPRAAAAAPRHACLVATPGTNSTSNQQSGLGCMSAALLSWGHADRTLRLKRRDARPEPVLTVPPHRHITSVATCLSGACPVLVGDSSGRLMALLDLGTVATRAQLLHAHTDAIVDINVCVRGGLVATASVDGLVVLWDLNKLTYIRTLPNRDMVPVTHVTISDTLCDVATVHDLTAPRAAVSTEKTDKSDVDDSDSYEKDNCNFSSLIRVHTCNATFVGSVKVVEKVTAVCYSNAPEGVSVNSIAAGLSTGGVRLYSSWDLRPVSYIPPVTAGLALISICYSCDGDVLFGITEGGGGVAWDAGRGRTPLRLLPAHALL